MIAVVDYDVGNLSAIVNMYKRLGLLCEITSDPVKIKSADKIILPGNGAFDACMQGLRKTGLVSLLEERVLGHHIPLLGICVGAQMLGHGSEEGVEPGLGWIDMQVKRLPNLPKLRIPHMSWCDVRVPNRDIHFCKTWMKTRVFILCIATIAAKKFAGCHPLGPLWVGFCCSSECGQYYGCAVPSRKSHRYGKQLLAEFARSSK